jgi:O-antigen ligase
MKISVLKSLFVSLAVIIFYTNIPVYLYAVEYMSISPLFWIGLFTATVIFIFALEFINGGIKCEITGLKPLLYWAFFFITISMLWYIFTNNTDIVDGALRKRFLSVIFLFLFMGMLHNDKKLQTKVRWVLLLAVLIAIANNVYDIVFPFTFVPLDNEFANPGRAAGFYINANQAGAALIIGMIFTIGLLPDKYRTPYVYLVFSGILLTFSRSALLGWFIVILIYLSQGMLKKKHIFAGLFIIVLVVTLSLPFMPDILQPEEGREGINIQNIFERIDWFFDPIGLQDSSSQERKQVYELSWEMFTDHPLIGNGLASTLSWSERASTHNMYLYYLVDHGIIGVFILPLFVLAIVWRASGNARQIAIPFVVFVLFWGFFTHNMLEEYYFLIAFAIMASMTIQSQYENKQRQRGNA